MDISVWKKAKKEQKMTFDELSQKSGVPKRTLEDVFSGRTQEPRLSTIEAIERALGINEKSPAAQDTQPSYIDKFVRDFGDLFADETFRKYATLYKMMNAAQRLLILGMIIGQLEKAGIAVPSMLH